MRHRNKLGMAAGLMAGWIGLGLVSGCAHWGEPVGMEARPTPVLSPVVGHGRGFLPNGFDEDTPDEIFAYVVLERDPPGRDAEERLQAVAAAFWQSLPPVIRTQARGTCYWPLTEISPAEAQRAAELNDWSVLAAHYHHDRARLILQRIGGLPGVGPQLVASRQPLGKAVGPFVAGTEPWLVLDLAEVPLENLTALLHVYRDLVLMAPPPAGKNWDLPRLKLKLSGLVGTEIDNVLYLKSPESAK
jgi:hypothetical protein